MTAKYGHRYYEHTFTEDQFLTYMDQNTFNVLEWIDSLTLLTLVLLVAAAEGVLDDC